VVLQPAIGKADSLFEPLQGAFEGRVLRRLSGKADFLSYVAQIHRRLRSALVFGPFSVSL
jgi:hypothetical protein